MTLNDEYDPQRPGSFAIDDNKTSRRECAVAKWGSGNYIMITIDMRMTVTVGRIEVLPRSDCCRKYKIFLRWHEFYLFNETVMFPDKQDKSL